MITVRHFLKDKLKEVHQLFIPIEDMVFIHRFRIDPDKNIENLTAREMIDLSDRLRLPSKFFATALIHVIAGGNAFAKASKNNTNDN